MKRWRCDSCGAEKEAINMAGKDQCQDCAEAAWERRCSAFYGADTPQTDRERYHAAARADRRLG